MSHWSGELGPRDVHPTALPRRTRLPRSLLDLACSAQSERRARAVVFTAVQQGLVSPDGFAEALSRRGPCRHHGEIAETLSDLVGGIRSVPEKDFAAIVRGRHLPPPTHQAVLHRANGRCYLDALWEPYCLCVEVDGTHHRDGEQWEDDLDRSADIVADGLRLIRFTSHAVRRKAGHVGDVLDRALRGGGWDGTLV